MDPTIGKWVRVCFCEETEEKEGTDTLNLRYLVNVLMPGRNSSFGRLHAGGADSHWHWSVYYELLKLAWEGDVRVPQ